jgi:hypothetical protein
MNILKAECVFKNYPAAKLLSQLKVSLISFVININFKENFLFRELFFAFAMDKGEPVPIVLLQNKQYNLDLPALK